MSLNKNLSLPNFKDIKVSTKTFTASTNINVEIDKLFDIIEITPYILIPKKRGRKKKGEIIDPNKHIKYGSIITVKYEDKIKGVDLKQKKQKISNKKWFRNSITIVIILDKPINFKVCRNGTFQMTGCKHDYHVEECIKILWGILEKNNDIFSFTPGKKNLEILIIPSMRNIDFSLGFNIDREKLNQYMWDQDKFYCLLETSFGYTGVNIKIPLEKNINKMIIKKLSYDLEKKEWNNEKTTYEKYLDILDPKDKKTKLKSERYNTFLVFHSGKVIMSGLTFEFMEDIYNIFVNLMIQIRPLIEEKLVL